MWWRRDHVVARLGAAIEAHDEPGARAADQVVGEQAFTGVAEPEIDDDERALFGVRH